MAALLGTQMAKTTARLGAIRLGTARLGFAPRRTTDHVPGSSVHTGGIPRYYIYGQTELPRATNAGGLSQGHGEVLS